MTLKRLLPLIEIVALAVAGYLIYRVLRGYSLEEILQSITALSIGHLAMAAVFAAGSYLSLIVLDILALRSMGDRLSVARIAFASFVGMAVSYNIGVSFLGSAALRYRFYASWGRGAADVARVVLFCSVAMTLGLAMLAGFVLLFQPTLAADLSGVGPRLSLAAGILCLALVGAYFAAASGAGRRLRRRFSRLPVPSFPVAVAQGGVGCLNFALVAAILHQTLAASVPKAYVVVLVIFVVAKVAAVLSNVPGGLGVLEAVILSFLPQADVVGPLVAFRVVYCLIPLALAGLLFTAYETRRRWRTVAARGSAEMLGDKLGDRERRGHAG